MTMQKHSCDTCSRDVLVEKFSPVHTSIQWRGGASACPLIAQGGTKVGDSSRQCTALRRSIDRAVNDGAIAVTQVELPTGDDIPRLTRETECS